MCMANQQGYSGVAEVMFNVQTILIAPVNWSGLSQILSSI